MAYLLAKDTVADTEGSMVIAEESRNYVVAGVRNITTSVGIQNSGVRVIGTHTVQDKPSGTKLMGTGNICCDTNL